MITELGAFDPNADYTGKYVYVFKFENEFGVPHCHCTHKYLGAVDEQTRWNTQQIVSAYWDRHWRELQSPQLWLFNKFSMFGPEKDTPVLERLNYAGMLLDLKADLDRVVPDKWPYYRPHVTIPAEMEFLKLPMKPVTYALQSGGETIQEWPMGRGWRR